MFRSSFQRRRCLIPVNSFFEWSRMGSPKAPFRILLTGEQPFALAGIWAPPASAGGRPTFAIITTTANGLVGQLHDRMPVILEEGMEPVWLHENTPLDVLLRMLRPYDARSMTMYPVSSRMNSAQADDAKLIVPLRDKAA